ncbi:DUF983 domain-containing protein [Acuticoccus sp. M5D2P5]|uniref:DUF983 domain-containing protein n=1 Tax=Acuticoccus kalidii TaxID=2910977 RepID=UPI001F2F69AA|nr:DUF983 domain-containing protein [Acuticoccus kalidii]MCF3933580.1 DUF983 domain-containing protein [Acuticoccus kalidii]
MTIQDPIIDRSTLPNPLVAGMKCRCPRCGKGKLFQGFLALRKECNVCGLKYDFADPADGPAFFVLCFACVPVVGLAIWFEMAMSPPVWVHLITTVPLIIVACSAPLRPLKAWLIASQYYHSAAEGRLHTPSPPSA